MVYFSTVPTEVHVVAEFPETPAGGVAYSLAGAKKEEVTRGTHSLHKYPAKFIPQIPRWAVLNLVDKRRATVLDPFCGSGTCLVEAGRLGFHSIGADISPLAALVTRAKCSVLPADAQAEWSSVLPKLLDQASADAGKLEALLQRSQGVSVLGLHHTWANWFQAKAAARLLALRHAIERLVDQAALKDCALTSLSSIVKACSSLNEDQIKVRFDAAKKVEDPLEAFERAANEFVERQSALSVEYRRAGASFEVLRSCASALPLDRGTVDLIVTSPPYINAVDYTMTHKYNLFVLGLLEPESFKDHCREYIGVTERAVRTSDIAQRPPTAVPEVRDWVSRLDDIGTPTAQNRAYVVNQYFNGMHASLVEAARVLKRGGRYFMVVGEQNRICGLRVPTAQLIGDCARMAGLNVRKQFHHALANRSSMRLSRSDSGGEIPFERIFIFER